jgi:hypothetical protein
MKPRLNINESFICKIWEGGDLYYSSLQTTDGRDVEVISHGRRNQDAGPDYKEAKIKIDGKILTGDVEIHRDFKNWDEHAHGKDRKYNPVILHVVLWDSEDRQDPKLRIKRNLPTVVLSNHLKESIHEVWQDIISKPSERLILPCHNLNDLAGNDTVAAWLDTLADERLNVKVDRFKQRLNEIKNEADDDIGKKRLWEELLYEFTFEALGFSKNKEQMLRLSSGLSLESLKNLLRKNDSIIYLQSVLFGTAGFLFDVRVKDDYINAVKKYWKDSEGEIQANRLNRHEWNFFRMRPQNFPTIRLAYGAQVILKLLNEDLLKNIILIFETDKFNVSDCCNTISELFKPETDKYWQSHYDLGKISKSQNKLIGSQRIEDIIINVIIPLVYLYSAEFNNPVIKTNILSLYHNQKIKPDNSVVKVVQKQVIKNRKITINTPAYEQAAIQLYNFYCMRERCNECEIGRHVFSDKGYEYKIIFY